MTHSRACNWTGCGLHMEVWLAEKNYMAMAIYRLLWLLQPCNGLIQFRTEWIEVWDQCESNRFKLEQTFTCMFTPMHCCVYLQHLPSLVLVLNTVLQETSQELLLVRYLFLHVDYLYFGVVISTYSILHHSLATAILRLITLPQWKWCCLIQLIQRWGQWLTLNNYMCLYIVTSFSCQIQNLFRFWL